MPGIEYWARGARAAEANSIPQRASTPIQNATKSASQLNLSAQPPGQLQRIPQPVVSNSVPQFAEPPPVRGKVNLGPAPKLALNPPINSYWTPRSQALMDLPIRGKVDLRPPLPRGFPPGAAAILPKIAGKALGPASALTDPINPATSSQVGGEQSFGFPTGLPIGEEVSGPSAGNPFGMPTNAGASAGSAGGQYANGPGWYVRGSFQAQVDENGPLGPVEETVTFVAALGAVASVTLGQTFTDNLPWANPAGREILTTSGQGLTQPWGRFSMSAYHRMISATVEQIGAQPAPFPPSRPGDTPYFPASDTPDPLPFDSPAIPAPAPAQVPSGGTTSNPVPTPTPQRAPIRSPQVQPGQGLPQFLPDPEPLPPLLPRTNPNPNSSGQSSTPAFPTPLPLVMPSAKPAPPGAQPLLNPATGTATDLTPKVDRPPGPQPNISCADPCMVNLSAGQQAQTAQQAATNSKLDQLTAALGVGSNLQDLGALGKLNEINSKLGPQLPGGLSGKLQSIQQFAETAWKSTRLDKVMNALTLITVLHNAAMLSTSLASTLGDVTSQALAVIGIKDEQNSPIDVNEILAKTADEFAKTVLGEEIWNGTKASWKKLNRIVTTASNIVWSIRSIADSAKEVAEWTAENTGKIGNALKRFRVVGEKAYGWMPEQINSGSAVQRRWDKIRNGTENLDDAASSLQGVLSEVGSIQEEFNQLDEQKKAFDKALTDATPKPRAENTATKTAADLADSASTSPNIANPDRAKANP